MLPLMGLVMAMALLSGIFSVDVGLLYDGREKARTAADMAALAGAQELPTELAAKNVALDWAALNGFDCGDYVPAIQGCENAELKIRVTAGSDYDGLAVCPTSCVAVEIQRNWKWLLGGLLHLDPVTITASSSAEGVDRDILIALDTSEAMCGTKGGGAEGCEQPSVSSLVGLDVGSNFNDNDFDDPLPNLNDELTVDFALTNPSEFKINGVSVVFNPTTATLQGIIDQINATVPGISATLSEDDDTLTLTRTTVGALPIDVDDILGNFFRAMRFLADPQPTRLVGQDVDGNADTVGSSDLSSPRTLLDLNGAFANFDVEFVPGNGEFCIETTGSALHPCTAGTHVTYNTSESMATVTSRITSLTGVTAVFDAATDTLTLTRKVLGPVAIRVSDLSGNFLQATQILQAADRWRAEGLDVSTDPDSQFDQVDLDAPSLLPGLNDELLVDLALGSGSFVINGVTIAYGMSDSLNDVVDRINSSAAGVLASVNTATDTLALTRTTVGGTPITFSDVANIGGTGNFLQAMRFIAPIQRTTVVGLDLGVNLDLDDMSDDLTELDDELNVDFAPTPTSRFMINGVLISYDPNDDSLDDVLARINSSAAGVTAAIDLTADTLTLTRNAYGPLPGSAITFSDVEGNFFHAMQFLGGNSATTIVGGDVGDLTDSNYANDVLDTLNAQLTVDFQNVPTGAFTINGTVITYDPQDDELDDIINAINTSPADVTAVFDTTSDQLTITRNSLGDLPITFTDNAGNFFQAMQFLGGGGTKTTAVGLDVGDISSTEFTNDHLEDLDGGDLAVLFQDTDNGSFTINGAVIGYSTQDDDLQEVLNRINADATADVTATFDTGTDRLTLTRDTLGALPITFSDNVGNFFRAMQFLGGSRTTAVGGDVGDLDSFDMGDDLTGLNNELTVDFQPVTNGSFTINGSTIVYNATNDSINEIIADINASVGADVTATFNTTTDRLTLTRDTYGALPITFADVTGNFFAAMQFVTGGTPTTAVGLDVADCGGCDIGTAELQSDLAGGTPNGDMTVDFLDVSNGSFTVNGATINYNASNDTIESILTAITNSGGADVTATFDTSTDRLTFTRKTPGALAITMADVTGNFLAAMRMIAPATGTRLVGGDVGDVQNSGDLNQNLNSGTMNNAFSLDFAPVTNGSFTINGATINYNATNQSINTIIAAINASGGADVTATFDVGTDIFTLTRDTAGALDITISDVTGNFFQAMQMLSPATYSTLVGQDIDTFGTNFDASDFGVTLPSLNDELDVDVALTNPSQFSINSVAIPTFNPNTATLNSIKTLIDGSAADVTATYDENNDTLTLTRKTAGNLPITVADNTGNFLQAMKLLSPPTATTAVGGDVGDISSTEYTNDHLELLDGGDLAVQFQDTASGSFTIDGVLVGYSTQDDDLQEVINRITSLTDVNAAFDTNTGRLTLTRKTAGALPITFSDNVGNFMQAMQMLAGGTFTRIVGLDLDASDSPFGSQNQLDSGDGSRPLRDLNASQAQFVVPFTLSNNTRSFTINGVSINYCARSDNSNCSSPTTAGSTLASVVASINSFTDVVATLDYNTDTITLTRKVAGSAPITLSDNGSGNFLAAMRLIPSGVQTLGTSPSVIATITMGGAGGGSTIGTYTAGTTGGILIGTKTMGTTGGTGATITLGNTTSTVIATITPGTAESTLATITLGIDPTLIATVTPGSESSTAVVTGGVTPGAQTPIAVVTGGQDPTALPLLGDLVIGDDEDIGHLIATYTPGTDHSPFGGSPAYFWEPLGPVQHYASEFSRSARLSPADVLALASFADSASVSCALPVCDSGPPGSAFTAPGSSFEQALLELRPEGLRNIGAGICVAIDELTLNGRPGAQKTIVLLAVGPPNNDPGDIPVGCPPPDGSTEYPVQLANLAAAQGIVIHTIGLGNLVDVGLMQDIATITGGAYFQANIPDDLGPVFEEIAGMRGISLLN